MTAASAGAGTTWRCAAAADDIDNLVVFFFVIAPIPQLTFIFVPIGAERMALARSVLARLWRPGDVFRAVKEIAAFVADHSTSGT